MHKGMYSAPWVLFCLLIIGCGGDTPPNPNPNPNPPSEITVTGKIMLGPVVRGHSLQLVIYDADMKELDRPKIGLDGSYGFKLKDYKGVIIAQVTSENPDKCSGDYIDEATAKPKCLGKNAILSSTHVQSGTSDNQAKLHTTPVTTVAVLHAGVLLDDNGGLTIPKGLTQEHIAQSNKAVAKVFGLGDQSIAEYTPTSIITTDQKFKTGDAYTKALAAISGVEAIDSTKNLNNVLKKISSAISTDSKNPALNPALQDTMVKGLQKVAEKIKANSGDITILKNLSKYQDKFPKSIVAVDLTKTLPNTPSFTNETKIKTSNLTPTWHWQSGGSNSGKYQYRLGQTDRTWKNIDTNKFMPSKALKSGKHTLIIRQADANEANLWSKSTRLTIEIATNKEGSVTVKGEKVQGEQLIATVYDDDGIQSDVKYQWFRDNKITGMTNGFYYLTQEDVNTKIKVITTYTDNNGFKESPNFIIGKIENINDKPTGKPIISGNPKQGVTLTVDTREIKDKDGLDQTKFEYQWLAGEAFISGATDKTLALNQTHVGKLISVRVSYTDNGGENEILPDIKSNSIVQNINDEPTGKPIISVNRKEMTLTVDTSEIKDKDRLDQTKFEYQWLENDKPIKNETLTTFTPTQKQDNKEIRVRVEYIDKFNKRETVVSDQIPIYENYPPELKDSKLNVSHIDTLDKKGVIDLSKIATDRNRGEQLYIFITKNPEKGKLTIGNRKISVNDKDLKLEDTNNLIYTRTDFGKDTFEFTVSDTKRKSEIAKVTIAYTDIPPEIIFNQDTLKLDEDGEGNTYQISVVDTDSPDGVIELKTLHDSKLSSIQFSKDRNYASDETKNFIMKIKPKENKFGAEEISIIASSGGQNDTKTFTIDIKPKEIKLREISNQIDVCWIQITDPSAKIQIPVTAPQKNIQTPIQKIIINSWVINTAIKIKFYQQENCPNNKKTLKISYTEDNNFKDQKAIYLPESHAIIFHSSINEDERTIIHEFGHALGFPDEHARLDVYRAGSYEQQDNGKVCTQIVNGRPILLEDQTYHGKKREERGLKVVSMADWQKQPYNPFSVMNDCFSASKYNETFREKENKLSDDDIKRAQQFYGAPLGSDQTKHMTKDVDEFFTGLYKTNDGSSYDFYEYGVKYDNYKITDPKISDYEDYFYIPKKSQSTTTPPSRPLLFKYIKEKDALMPTEDLFIICIKQDSTQGFCVNHDHDHDAFSYYYHDFYGKKNQFSTILCKNIEDIQTTVNTTKFPKIDNDYSCIDLLDYYWDTLIHEEITTEPIIVLYFMKGTGVSGNGFSTRLNVLDARFEDGLFINPTTYIETYGSDGEKLRYKYKEDNQKSPITGFTSVFKIFEQKNKDKIQTDIQRHYYLNGEYVENNNRTQIKETISWKINDSENQNVQVIQNNTYVFFKNEMGIEKLYKNGELYTGEYNSQNYTKGVLD